MSSDTYLSGPQFNTYGEGVGGAPPRPGANAKIGQVLVTISSEHRL